MITSLYTDLDIIFSEKFKIAVKNKFDSIKNNLWQDYLKEAYLIEYHSTLVYPILHQRFQENFYDNLVLSAEDKKYINNFFYKLIEDENNHTSSFKEINTLFQVNINDKEINQINQINKEILLNYTPFQVIISFYIGECYYGTTFLKLYQTITDKKLKAFFRDTLKDEAKHINFFRKIITKIFTSDQFDYDFFINQIKQHRYFSINFFHKELNLSELTYKKNIFWEPIIFDNEWQRDFNEKFLRKIYVVLKSFNQDISFENFQNIINKS